MKKIYLLLVLQLAAFALFAQTPYCSAGANPTEPNTEKISRVVLGSIDNASTSTSGYEDFTSLAATLNQGSVNNMSVELSDAILSDQVLVWIDFNQDGDFTDAGEAVYTSPQGKGPFSFTVAVPTSAKPGATRMRVRLHDTGYGPNSTPCGNSDYGQVEDYSINMVSYSPYCEASAPVPYGAGNIVRVMLGSIDNTSGDIFVRTTTSYEDFTRLSTNLGQGSENRMTVYSGGPPNSFLRVWIDFNQDGDFTDAGETVYTGIGSDENFDYGFNFTVNVPAGALLGPTRMRVRGEFDYFSTVNNVPPCGNDDREGQAEDYTVNITPVSRYCAAGGGPDYSASPIERISHVMLGTINNASTSKSGYENFTTFSDTVKQGSVNNMSVELSNGYASDQVLVWIDFNQDGDFTDAGEAVYTSPQGRGPFSFTVAVPTGAKPGATRMRVRMGNPNYVRFYDPYMDSFRPNNTPCGYSQVGQVEDYTIVVTACTPHTFYKDYDKDGFGDPAITLIDCSATPPDGYVTDSTDCNDQDASVHTSFNFYVDSDGDGFGSGSAKSVCAVDANTPPAGYSLNSTDCAPTDATKWQSANLYIDVDGDGYDAGSTSVCYGATIPQGYSSTTLGSDCNDGNAAVHPGAVEICGNGIDDNCNGQTDENCTVTYSLSVNDVSMIEGNKGKSNMTFTVTLNKASNKKVTVQYKTQNGTATASSDYTAKSGTLTFNPGSTTQSVAISIIGDKTVEPNETFTVVLSNPVNAGLLKGTGTGTILNDDGTTPIAARAVDVKAGTLEVSGKLTITVSPNPSYSYFTLHTKSGSDKPLQVKTIDVAGRQIETRGSVPANGTLMLGGNYRPGIYFTEVLQGSNRVTLKLIKQ